MDTSENGIALIKGSEGKKTLLPDGRYKAYLDTLAEPHVWTIWAGLTKGVHEGMILTEAQCEAMFQKELNVYEDAIERYTTAPLNQNQFDALVSLVYNIGPGDPSATDPKEQKGYYWSSIRRLINAGKPEQAAARFPLYNKAGGRVWRGLVTRRAKEASLFLKPIEQTIPVDVVEPEHGGAPQIDEKTIIPQSVDAPTISVTKEAAKSPSMWSAGLGVVASAISTAWGWISGVATDTTAEIGAAKQGLSGFDALFSLLKVNLGLMFGLITLACLAVVIVRKLNSIRQGAA